MNTLTVICPNSRRCLVKVTPSTQLRKVLEEACLRQGFDISGHELKHQNRTLDLALPLRLTGLSNNATVEMIPSTRVSGVPAQVQIALQLADGSRLIRNFSNKANLLDILHEFSQETIENLGERNDGQVPVCAYMNKEYRGEAELKSTTLEAMGIVGGRCLIRYFAMKMSSDELKRLENRLAEENIRKRKLEGIYQTRKRENERRLQLEVEREKIFERELKANRESEASHVRESNHLTCGSITSTPLSTPVSSEVLSQNVPEPVTESELPSQAPSRLHQLQSLLNRVNASLDTNAADFPGDQIVAEDGRIHINNLRTAMHVGNTGSDVSSSNALQLGIEKCNRMPVIIRQDSESDESRKEDLAKRNDNIDDQFFELTVNDVRSMQRDLKIQAGEQTALFPRTYVAETNKRLKEESYKHTVVRFNFADKIVLQAQFISKEPVLRLFEFITENLKNKEAKFDIYLVSQKLPATDAKNLIDVGVAPKSSLYIRFHAPENTFAANFVRDKFCEIPVSEADELSREWLSVNEVYRPYDPKVASANDDRPNGKRQSRATENCAGPSKLRQQPCANFPKWFKKP